MSAFFADTFYWIALTNPKDAAHRERILRLTKTTGRPCIMDEDEFEWDATKAESNLEKHGVIFEAARCVFDDVFALDRCDFDSEPGDVRYVITGMVSNVILTVVYGAKQRTRIISARKATKHEQTEYYRSQTAE